MLEKARQDLLAHIRAADIVQARSALESWLENHGYESTMTELVEPVMRYDGGLWSRGEDLNLAQGYIVVRVVEDALASYAEGDIVSAESVKGPVVLGNAEDDFHFLGRKMVMTFLRASGWRVIDLGNDVPADEFVDRAIAAGSAVIGVSAMTYTNSRNIRRVREAIDRRDLTDQIRLAVGGAAFVLRPQLVQEVGGDGTAPNAVDAPQLFDRLWSSVVDSSVDLQTTC